MAIYGVGALAAADIRWGMRGRWNAYATVALLGAGFAPDCPVVVHKEAVSSLVLAFLSETVKKPSPWSI